MMKTSLHFALPLALACALALAGCGPRAVTPTASPTVAAQPTNSPAPAQPTNTPAQPTATPASQEEYPPVTPEIVEPTAAYPEPTLKPDTRIAWNADGLLGPNEYRHQRTLDKMFIAWVNDAEYLYLAVQGPTTGWVAIGIDPANRMQGANFLMGAVVDGETEVWDAFGMAPVGPNHPQDTELGGTMDVIASAGLEKDGSTLVEFQIPLDSGDEFDKPLIPGETYRVIVAYGDADGFTSPHAYRGDTEIELD